MMLQISSFLKPLLLAALVAMVNTTTVQANLITNGDFGQGFSNWVSIGPNSLWGGSWGIVAEIGAGNSAGSSLSQTFAVSGGPLDVSFRVGEYQGAFGNDPWNMDVTIKDSSANIVWSTTVNAYNPNASTSYDPTLSFNFTTGSLAAGNQTITFAPNGHGWTTIGNVSVTSAVVPEPSSVALLGLGGAGLAIGAYRRRRMASV